MQTTTDTIKQGKNVGKKNATTPEQQALVEAQSQHEKKLKAGYVTTLEAAQAGEVDDLVEGGVLPMLAKQFEEYSDKLSFPVAVQPKLDGHRCFAVVDVKIWHGPFNDDGTGPVGKYTSVDVSLWTRTRKRMEMPHVAAAIKSLTEAQIGSPDFDVSDEPIAMEALGFTHSLTDMTQTTTERRYRRVLDGEMYRHDFRDRFEELSSHIRKPREGTDAIVQYHVYDVVGTACFSERIHKLENVFPTDGPIRLVETVFCDDAAGIHENYTQFRRLGYEGAMVRQLRRGYDHKRSDQLLKVKDFVDAEFKIVRCEEGRGRLQGHVGAFVCVTADGKEFAAKMEGATERLREYWEKRDVMVGRTLTVKFQGLTSSGVPRFPTALRFRDEAAA